MDPKSFYLVSLGCAKNTVDSDSMAELMIKAGYKPVSKPGRAEILIINTCGFIQPARQESLEELDALVRKKKPGQKLIAAGCLSERLREQIGEKVPGVDAIISTRRWMDILDVVNQLRKDPPKPLYHLPEVPSVGRDERGVLRASIQGGSAYLKIADGCRRPCAFCSIPLIKGSLVSRPADTIIREAQLLESKGVQELVLIAQDTTDYGYDLGIKDGLPGLLEGILAATSIPWIRILYAYPGYVSDQLIEVMASNDRILPYLDIPLQHAHPDTLRRMRRPANMEWVYTTLAIMRKAIPGLALRSAFIVGYPGETEQEFQALVDFLEEIKFDRAAAFTFSFETGTASEPLGDPIPEKVKLERYQRFMEVQADISLRTNQTFIGRTLQVLIEGYHNGLSVGRSYRDAPEVDGMVFIEGQLPVGKLAPVLINGTWQYYDLTGVPARTIS